MLHSVRVRIGSYMVYTHALVSRPRPQGDELAGWLEAAHLEPVHLPVFRFEAVDEPVSGDRAWRESSSRLLVFTSPRAVHFGLPALEGRMLWGSRLASIGPATTRALSGAGLDCLQAPGPDFDSEALLDFIQDTLEPGAALLLTAPGGREALRKGLVARGWAVREVPVYRRLLLDPEPKEVGRLEAAERVLSVWTSGTALEHLMERLSDKARRLVRQGTAIVISERLADLAREQGIGDVQVTEGPGNGDILKCFHLLGARE